MHVGLQRGRVYAEGTRAEQIQLSVSTFIHPSYKCTPRVEEPSDTEGWEIVPDDVDIWSDKQKMHVF